MINAESGKALKPGTSDKRLKGFEEMKANITPTPQMVDRMKDQASDFYSRWMELNWCITFVTVCKSLKLGKARANRLFQDIVEEMARHNEYENYKWSCDELKKELERLEIPCEFFSERSTSSWKQTLHREKIIQESKKAGIAESYEMAAKLKKIRELI